MRALAAFFGRLILAQVRGDVDVWLGRLKRRVRAFLGERSERAEAKLAHRERVTESVRERYRRGQW